MSKKDQARQSGVPRDSGSLAESINVIELIRVNSVIQTDDDRGAVTRQREQCREIAERNGLTIKWEIEITGISGTDVIQSPEMKRLQEIIESGECSGVVLRDVSRFVRPEDFGDYAILGVMTENKIKLFTKDATFDFSDPSTKFMLTVYAGVESFRREAISKRRSLR